MDMSNELYDQTRAALDELLARAVKALLCAAPCVVGCSSSEALGGLIGHDSSPEAGLAMARAALDSPTHTAAHWRRSAANTLTARWWSNANARSAWDTR